MDEITTNSILAQVKKSPTTETSFNAAPEVIGTPSGTQSDPQAELQRSDRSRTRSSRAKEGGYDDKLAANKQRSVRAKHTRTHKAKSSHTHSDAESVGSRFTSAASETDYDGRNPSRSPTPFAVTDKPEAQTSRTHLKEQITQKFHQVLEDSGTQTLMEVDGAISADLAYASQPEEQDLEARFLSPSVVVAGGGFHLDHPTHCHGNSQTYRGSKGRPRTVVASGSNQVEPDAGNLSILSPAPICDPDSPFVVPHGETFLGYPSNQGSCSVSPVLQDKNPASHSPSPSLSHEILSDGTSGCHRPLRNEDSVTHISTSSKSLGDRIPTPTSAPKPCTGLTLGSTHSDLQQSHRSQQPDNQGQTRPEGHRHSTTPALTQRKRPLATPATPLPARKLPATTARSTVGGKAYSGRLNIVQIGLARPLMAAGHSREVTQQRTPSQTQQKGKGTTHARTHTTPAPQRTGNDDIDLLDELDEDELIDSPAKGVLVEKSGYWKPTVHDLIGHERSVWKEVLDMTWAFSMGQGNFSTRGVYASWVAACYINVVELKLPSLDATSITMSDNMMTLELNSLCNRRYGDYIRLCDVVANYFRLKNPSTADKRQANKNRIKEIHPNYFHYKDVDKRVDPYEGEILFVALEAIFFYGPQAIGSKYPGLFERGNEHEEVRKHLAVLAYLATMIQFCLEEWAEGFFDKGTLDATTQQSVWLCHFDGLKIVSLVAPDQLVGLYNKWVQKAYDVSRAKARFTKKRYVQNVICLEDVRPNTPRSRVGPPSDD